MPPIKGGRRHQGGSPTYYVLLLAYACMYVKHILMVPRLPNPLRCLAIIAYCSLATQGLFSRAPAHKLLDGFPLKRNCWEMQDLRSEQGQARAIKGIWQHNELFLPSSSLLCLFSLSLSLSLSYSVVRAELQTHRCQQVVSDLMPT